MCESARESLDLHAREWIADVKGKNARMLRHALSPNGTTASRLAQPFPDHGDCKSRENQWSDHPHGRRFGIASHTTTSRNMPPVTNPSRTQSSACHQAS